MVLYKICRKIFWIVFLINAYLNKYLSIFYSSKNIQTSLWNSKIYIQKACDVQNIVSISFTDNKRNNQY